MSSLQQDAPASAPRAHAADKWSDNLGLPKCNQVSWGRIVRLHALLCQNTPFTVSRLEKEFETNARNIRRTLHFMRDSLDAPVDYDADAATWRYTRPWPYLPPMCVKPDEKFILRVLERAFPGNTDSKIGSTVGSVLKGIELITGGEDEVDSLEHVMLPAALLGGEEQKHLYTVHQAIARRRELHIMYLKAGATAPELHVVQPHRLRFIKQWTLLTHDVTRGGALRTLVLKRVQSIKTAKTGFTRPPGFDPDKILDGNLGAYTGTEDHIIRVRLRGSAAIAASDRPWHKSQKETRHPDGSLEIALRLNNLVEVKNEILHWGPEAVVLEPPALRAAVRQSHLAAAAAYAEDGAVGV